MGSAVLLGRLGGTQALRCTRLPQGEQRKTARLIGDVRSVVQDLTKSWPKALRKIVTNSRTAHMFFFRTAECMCTYTNARKWVHVVGQACQSRSARAVRDSQAPNVFCAHQNAERITAVTGGHKYSLAFLAAADMNRAVPSVVAVPV